MIDQRKVPDLRTQNAMDDKLWLGHGYDTSADYGIGSKAVNFLRLFQEIHAELQEPYNQILSMMEDMDMSPVLQRAVCLCLASDFTLNSLCERSELTHVDHR